MNSKSNPVDTYQNKMVELFKSKNLKYRYVVNEINTPNDNDMFDIVNIKMMTNLLSTMLCVMKEQCFDMMKKEKSYLIPVVKNPKLNITDEFYKAFGSDDELIMTCVGAVYGKIITEHYDDIYASIKDNIDNGCDFEKLPGMVFE